MVAIQGRWAQLTAQPDLIDQDQFGVCGTTTCVYLLLQHDPAKALELFEATFADIDPNLAGSVFQTAVGQVQIPIKFRYLARRFRLMERKKQAEAAIARPQAYNDAIAAGYDAGDATQYSLDVEADVLLKTSCFVDYCVSRGLGYVLKKTAPNRYDGEKMEFNMEFDPKGLGNYRNFTHSGNLALRTNNLAFILSNLLGAQNVHIASKNAPAPVGPLAAPVAGVGTSNFANVLDLHNEFTAHFTGNRRFAVAAVYGALVNNAHNGHLGESFTGGNPSLSYNHWVLIEGFNPTAAGAYPGCPFPHVNLQIWTWRQVHRISVCRNRLLSYIQDVIFGNF